VTRRPFDAGRRDTPNPALTDNLAEGQRCVELAAMLIDRFSYEAFMSDELIQNSACMLLIRLREVAKRLPQQFKDEHPDVPWRTIIGMGHLIAHEYAIRVDPDTVWNTLATEFPKIDVFRTDRR